MIETVVDPTDARDRYHAGRATLLERHPHLRDVLPAAPPPADASLLRRDGDGAIRAPLPDVSGAARGGFLVHGVPSPALLAHLLAVTGPHGYRPPLEIVEPDPVVLATWLRLVDPGLLREERLTIFGGPRAGADYVEFREARLARRDPTHVLRCSRPDWSAPRGEDDPGRRASAAVATRRGMLIARQDAFYDDLSPEAAAARFRRFRDDGASLRVLGITTLYSTVMHRSMQDLAAAFRRRGCDIDVVMEPDRSANDVDTWTVLARQPYDLVVLINTTRAQLADRLHRHVPCATWIQDHVASLATSAAGRAIGPCDRVLCPQPWSLAARFEYPDERLVGTSAVSGGDPFAAAPPTPEELTPFRCDVSYASHASAPVDRLVAELAAPKGPDFLAFLERIVDGLRAATAAHPRGIPFDLRLEIALRAEEATPAFRLAPAERAAAIVPLVECFADRLFRHEALEWTAAWARRRGREFRIYGHGWETHPTLAPYAHGGVENGRPLACLARASAVSLQINGYGSFHPRLLDTLTAGGFVLSRANHADFTRAPMLALAAYVAREGVENFIDLLDRVGLDPALDALLGQLRERGLFVVAAASDPARRREEHLLRAVYDFPGALLTDEARFEAIRTAAPASPRAAGDLPGFAELTFHDAGSLHALLDAYVDDHAAREDRARPLRAAVLAHDTTDVLVDRIVSSFCETA